MPASPSSIGPRRDCGYGDFDRLQQVVMNLLPTRRSSPRPGSVCVRLHRGDNDTACISVEDTGISLARSSSTACSRCLARVT